MKLNGHSKKGSSGDSVKSARKRSLKERFFSDLVQLTEKRPFDTNKQVKPYLCKGFIHILRLIISLRILDKTAIRAFLISLSDGCVNKSPMFLSDKHIIV